MSEKKMDKEWVEAAKESRKNFPRIEGMPDEELKTLNVMTSLEMRYREELTGNEDES